MVEEIRRHIEKQDFCLLWNNLLITEDILYSILEKIKFKILVKIVLRFTFEKIHTQYAPACTLKVCAMVTQRKKIGKKTKIVL